jgi:DNA-binding NarL/FixJ family response regulator
MQHWIIDRVLDPLPTWLEAFPTARMLRRDDVETISATDEGILWFRLCSGEVADSALSSLRIKGGQSVVVLADEPDDSLVTQVLSFGASGCCNTHAAPEVLRQVALVVENGGLWVGQHLLQQLLASTSRTLKATTRAPRVDWSSLLSEREVQVARLVAGGASNKEIAAQLSITERTVKAHLSAVFEKLELRDRLQLSLRVNGVSI